MITEVTGGISRKLHETFGEGYEIYVNTVEQGLTKPCFFIAPLSPSKKARLGRRYLMTYPFEIRFYPKDGTNNSAMAEVGERLICALEWISLLNGDSLRAKGGKYESRDGVIYCRLQYSMHLIEAAELPIMETLAVEMGTREEK